MIDCSKTIDYLTEKARMSKTTKSGICKVECAKCPLSSDNNGVGECCKDFEMLHPEKAIEIVQQWSNTYQQKTYLTEFLKHYPNVQLRTDGTPAGLCPRQLGLNEIADCGRTDNCCAECWNQPLPIEEDEE